MKKVLAVFSLLCGIALSSLAHGAAPTIDLEFNGSDPVKQIPLAMKSVKVDGGVLMGTISGSDPSFGFDFTKLKVSADDNPLFNMRMKVDAANGKPFDQVKLYFSTSDDPVLAEDKTIFINDVICDGDWYEYQAEMDSNTSWSSSLKYLRVDFEQISDATYAGTVVYLDWLHITNY